MIQKDLNFPHCYLVVVCMKQIKSDNPGHRFLKYRPIYFNNDDIDKVQKAEIRRTDELFQVSFQEALKLEGIAELVNTAEAVKAATSMNMGQLYLFRMQDKLSDPEEFFSKLVEKSNKNDEILEWFKEAEI
jgi:hypothetical protein